jgi:hypothetical protein
MFERRSILEVLRRAKERGSSLTLDSAFGNDVEAGIHEHAHETTIDPWA